MASNLSPLAQCLQVVESCDVYVGIFSFRYGFLPAGQKKSITHLDDEAAVLAVEGEMISTTISGVPLQPNLSSLERSQITEISGWSTLEESSSF